MLVSLVLVVTWVSSLGGLAVHPTWSVEMPEENDTVRLPCAGLGAVAGAGNASLHYPPGSGYAGCI